MILTGFSFASIFVITVVALSQVIENSLLNPVFYLLTFETFLYTASTSYPACYLGFLTLDLVLPLLKFTSKKFEEAVRYEDPKRLQVSISSLTGHFMNSVDDMAGLRLHDISRYIDRLRSFCKRLSPCLTSKPSGEMFRFEKSVSLPMCEPGSRIQPSGSSFPSAANTNYSIPVRNRMS